MFVIGTAGHIDHGKSTLVQALTGIDPDRLREEKARGMTIDLGFAWLKLPGGREVSVVDVPGHERFIKNMLAGVGGIDLAVLVIAADEGVMPQTSEHLAILDLLQIQSGIVAVTKSDLVDAEWLALVTADVEEAIKGTTLAQAPVIPVSAMTGEGLPELKQTIDRLLESTPQRQDLGRPRLPIDRVFTIAGFGTVVTGTLTDGMLTVGQEVEVLPDGRRTRVRGLQTHKHKVDRAEPGSRVAANLVGVSTEELHRGDVLTRPGWLRPSRAADVHLRVINWLDRSVAHNLNVTFHSGAAEVPAKLRLLDQDELLPGDAGWAQIRFAEPVPLVKGDYFIIRSPEQTLAGGQIVEPHAKRHRRFHVDTIDRLVTLEAGTPAELLVQALAQQEPAEYRALAGRLSFDEAGIRAALAEALATREVRAPGLPAGADATTVAPNAFLITEGGWLRLGDRVGEMLINYHRQFPLRPGMSKEELKSRLKLPPRFFAEAVAAWVREGAIAETETTVRLPDHEVRLTPDQQKTADAFLASLRAEPFSPPNDHLPESELLAALAGRGEIVRVSESVVFDAAAHQTMVDQIVQRLREQGTITVAEVRDLFGTSRKYALALMEHLDETKVTLRMGDERVLRRG